VSFKDTEPDLTSAAFEEIDEQLPFALEKDASDNAISATLNQEGRPVARFSRTSNKCELHQSIVEKKACAIVEPIRKWAHLLNGRRFTVVPDQQSISFIYLFIYLFMTRHKVHSMNTHSLQNVRR